MYARGWINLVSLRLGISYSDAGICNNVICDPVHHYKATVYWSSGRQCRFSSILVTLEVCR